MVLRLRLEVLLAEDCEDFALGLSGWCLLHPDLLEDPDILKTRLKLLHSLGHLERLSREVAAQQPALSRVCRTMTCHEGINIIEELHKTESNLPLCTTLIQTLLIHDWIRSDVLHCCTENLVRLWVQYQLLVDKDDEAFEDSVWAIAKLSSTSGQICTLVNGLREKRGDDLVQLYTYLFTYGLNLDKHVLCRLSSQGDQHGLKAQMLLISDTCRLMGKIFESINTSTAKLCYLAAFSLQPSRLQIQEMRRCWTRPRVCVSPELEVEDPLDVDNTTFMDAGVVSIASLLEVERLVERFRLGILSPGCKWEVLESLCRKYLQETRRGMQCFSPSID